MYAWSGILKNLRAKASSKNPRTTLTEFSQPPDCGKLSSQLGKIANNENGIANASEKPSITIIGFKKFPATASIITVPTIGAVHEKETRTSVRAIKKIPNSPPPSAFLFILLRNLLGILISKYPKNDIAKIKNIIAKIIFAVALVANSLANCAPKIAENKTPTIVKIAIIEIPKIIPVLTDSRLPFLASFEKKATVIGIIGKTHGVTIAINPANIAVKNDIIKLESLSFFAYPQFS